MAITHLLLISTNTDDREFAEEAAKAAKLELHQVSTAREGADFVLQMDDPMIILVDVSTQALYDDFENTFQESVGLFSEKIDPNRLHFLSADSLDTAKYLIQSPVFGNFVLRNYGIARESGEHYGRVISGTTLDRAFGLEKLMKPGCKIQTVKLVTSNQKQAATDAVRNYLTAAKFQTRMADLIANAVDETIMNSIFDAPIDPSGQQLYSATHRNTVLKLDGKASVEIQIGYDGKHVGVTAVDHWGSLDKTKLLKHMSTVYNQEGYKSKVSQAGAGIGLARTFQSGGISFFFSSENSARTEVTIFSRASNSFRDFKNQFRFLSTQFYF